ncbi:hypothetical protein MPB2EB_1068 [Mycoavidus sp. B2-EB]|nr:hypothetical protein MPB2EB_1068 [Mycoavidus sp. B2-EB]
MGRTDILLSELNDFERQFNRFWMSAAGLHVLYFACWVYYFKAIVWLWLLMIESNHTSPRCSSAYPIRHDDGL